MLISDGRSDKVGVSGSDSEDEGGSSVDSSIAHSDDLDMPKASSNAAYWEQRSVASSQGASAKSIQAFHKVRARVMMQVVGCCPVAQWVLVVVRASWHGSERGGGGVSVGGWPDGFDVVLWIATCGVAVELGFSDGVCVFGRGGGGVKWIYITDGWACLETVLGMALPNRSTPVTP